MKEESSGPKDQQVLRCERKLVNPGCRRYEGEWPEVDMVICIVPHHIMQGLAGQVMCLVILVQWKVIETQGRGSLLYVCVKAFWRLCTETIRIGRGGWQVS